MGAFTDGDIDTFMPRPTSGGSPSTNWEALTWSNFGASSLVTDAGGHSGERVLSPVNALQTFTAVNYGLQGMEAVGLRGSGVGLQVCLNFRTAGGLTIASLRCDLNGALQLFSGGTLIAVTANNFIQNSTYYTLEMAWGNVSPPVCEVRVNGARIANMTTSNFGASGGQPAGTVLQTGSAGTGTVGTAPVQAGAIAQNFLGDTSGGTTTSGIYWWYRKNGASIWVPVSTGSTFATTSDFEGPFKRFWQEPAAAANYPLNRWGNGAGTYPASIADHTTSGGPTGGTDGDTTYIQNGTIPTGVAADKVSSTFTALPVGSTRVGITRRVVIARLSGGTSTIRSGRRVAGVDTMDPNFVLGATYSVSKTVYLCMPDGTTVHTVSSQNAFEGVIEQVALT